MPLTIYEKYGIIIIQYVISEGDVFMERSNKKLKITLALLILVIIGTAVVFFARHAIGGATSMITAKSSDCGYVKYRDLVKYVSMSGNVSGSEKVSIRGESDLQVKKLSVKVGDTVKKGDVLCEFDSSKLKEQYETLKASTEKAQGASEHDHSLNERNLSEAKKAKTEAVKKAQEAIDSAIQKRDQAYNDYNKLVEDYNNLVGETNRTYDELLSASEEDADAINSRWRSLSERADQLKEAADELYAKLPSFDDAIPAARTAYDETVKKADADIQRAQDALDSDQFKPDNSASEKELKDLQEKIDRCIVKSPKDGVITQLNVSVGSVPSSPTIITLENASQLVISGKVNESDILRIGEDMEAEIKTSATGDKIISGKVKRIERIISADEKDASEGYTVEVSIDDKESDLLIGMTASVKIILNRSKNTLSVPYGAVIGGDNDGYYVFVATSASNGQYLISKRKIEKGFDGDYYLEVTSGNLNDGDIVLTNPRGVSDGDKLSLTLPEE